MADPPNSPDPALGDAGNGLDERERIEREHVEQLARAHAALAAAQDRSYWLERWGVDLNELMRRPAAGRVRAGLRAVREVKRAGLAVKRYADARLGEARQAREDDEISVRAAEARPSANGHEPPRSGG